MNKMHIILSVTAISMFVGLIVWMFNQFFSAYLFTISSIIYFIINLSVINFKSQNNTIQKRLRMQFLIGCLCFVLTGLLMFCKIYSLTVFGKNEWLVALIIGCIFHLWSAYRIK